MKIYLFVQSFSFIKNIKQSRITFSLFANAKLLFSYYKLDIKEAKEGRRDGLLIAFANHLPSLPFRLPSRESGGFPFF